MTTNDDTDTVFVVAAGEDLITVPGSSGQPTCTYRKLRTGEVTMDGGLSVDEADEFIVSSNAPNTYLYLVTCEWPNGDITIDYEWVTETSPADEVARARAELAEVLPPPSPQMSPEINVNHLVGLDTWVWLDPADFAPVTVTVEIPGLATTATATPTGIRLDPGDGSLPIDCDGLGRPYSANADPDTGCTHRYQYISEHSPSGTWDFTTTVVWEVTWTNTDGDSGTADPIDTETITPLQVIELQAQTTNG